MPGQSRRTFLKRSLAAAGLAVPACVLGPGAGISFAADQPGDLLIAGGTVIDGTGKARRKADVLVRAGRIVKTGDLGAMAAKQRLAADGKIVAPGFIDMHTHSDRTLLRDGLAQSAIRQGATAHVVGNCGGSPAPLNSPQTIAGQTFRTYGEFLAALKQSGVSINVAGLVGHNTIRTTVMGVVRRRPAESEMTKMKDWVDEAMRGGAVGMSTGLVSPPGTYAETGEIIELARVAAKHGGLYASHIRGEASTLVESVTEAIRIGREAKLPVQISHHKAAGKENWGMTRHTLRLVEEANRQGQTVRVDVYPYRAGSAGLAQLVPPWAHEGGRDTMLRRLKNADARRRIASEMTNGARDWPNFFRIDWNDIQIAGVASQANRRWVGKRIGDVARDRGCAGVDACIDLLIEESGNVRMINFIMDENEVRRVLAHKLSMIGSDGTAVSPATAKGQPHPRFYGCFPRVLGHYVRELELLDLETAIHKMTGMAAAQLGLPDRGTLRPGAAADVVIFDAARIIDRATFDDPHQYPAGIDTVIVNGRPVVHQGEHLGAKPGEILRPMRG